MYLGPSHLAHAFDKLMFDYVYVFLEKEPTARKRMTLLLGKAKQTMNEKYIHHLPTNRKMRLLERSMKELLHMTDEQIDSIWKQSHIRGHKIK